MDEGVGGATEDCAFDDCDQAADEAGISGSYWINPDDSGALEVYCDLDSASTPLTWLVDPMDLEAYWSFDDTTDADVGAYTGTLTGGASRSSSSDTLPGFGPALYSDNNDSSRLDLGTDLPFGAVQSSLSFWGNSINPCTNNQIAFLFSDGASYMTDLRYEASWHHEGTRRFRVEGPGCGSFTNVWHHHVYIDTGTELEVWFDGEQLSPETYSYASMSGYAISRFMSRPSFGTNGLHGYIDDVAMFHRALEADEISALYTAGAAGHPLLIP